jgi:hypothetical protein
MVRFRLVFLAVTFFFFVENLVANDSLAVDTTGKTVDSVQAWKINNSFFITFNQIAFSNWATGGETSISGKANYDFKVTYDKNRFKFYHESHFAFGMVGYFNKRLEKTDDMINLITSFGQTINKNWATTALINFKSQFARGYKYPDDSTLISEFMAPGYLTLSLGANFKPNDHFQIFLSPVSGKFTFVLNQELADKGAYGVKKAIVDTAGNIIQHGEKMLGELGMNIVTSYNQTMMKNIKFVSILTLHNNFIDKNKNQIWIFDIDWDSKMIFKINKLFATVFYFHLKYDKNAKFPVYDTNDEGEQVIVGSKAKVQIKESLGLSITFKI